jgi:hypothetical protein
MTCHLKLEIMCRSKSPSSPIAHGSRAHSTPFPLNNWVAWSRHQKKTECQGNSGTPSGAPFFARAAESPKLRAQASGSIIKPTISSQAPDDMRGYLNAIYTDTVFRESSQAPSYCRACVRYDLQGELRIVLLCPCRDLHQKSL